MTHDEAAALFGAATYTSDCFKDAVTAVFVRSPVPRARVASIDASHARLMSGVVGIWLADQLPVNRMPPPNPAVVPGSSPKASDISPLMASAQVQWLGQPLAVVVARSLFQALDASEAIALDLEPIESDASVLLHRFAQGSPQVQAPGLTTVRWRHTQPRVAACAMEPRALRIQWLPTAQRLECVAGSQAPVRMRDHVAWVCGLRSDQVRVMSHAVGGAFGAKASATPEELILAQIAMQIASPLFWQATRSEELLSAPHGRGADIEASLSAFTDGSLASLHAELRFEIGGWQAFSALVPARNAVRILPGPYRVPHVMAQAEVRTSPRTASSIYRGAGRPEAAMITEVLIERLARRLDIDPIALRLRHVLRPSDGAWVHPSGERLDAADYPALLGRASDVFGYAARRQALAARRLQGECVGIGAALYVEPCGQGFEWACVRWVDAQHIEVYGGSPSQGQHHASLLANLVATELAVDVSQVQVILGDTDRCPDGVGALASRSTAIGGSAVVAAARQVMTQRSRGGEFPLEARLRYEAPHEAWASGCVMAQVGIDTATGELVIEAISWVDDAGRLLQPDNAKAQLAGGAAQGLGQALLEALYFDAQGQLLSGSFMDYALPRAKDCPEIDLQSLPTATDANLLGVRGVGEAGCIGLPAAIYNAVMDALAYHQGYGIEEPDLAFPLTAPAIWAHLHQKA